MINDTFIKLLAAEGDAHYSLYPSPVGMLCLIGTDRELKALMFKKRDAGRFQIDKLLKKGRTREIETAARFLDVYFNKSGSSRPIHSNIYGNVVFKSPICHLLFDDRTLHLDLSGFTRNETAVYQKLLAVAPGKTISYATLSEKAGIPSGARFVGNAMAKNIFPIIIPCHRVIKHNGEIGNYSGGSGAEGIGIKRYLLNHEGGRFW
jgi:O-6-methylguanine DNA methyltransferase